MTDPQFQPQVLLEFLERNGVRYVLIGGLAATLHGSPVLTTDADICPARDPDNMALPTLRLLLERLRSGKGPSS